MKRRAVQIRARASAIRTELVKLSRNGWRNAKPCDYLPLEIELRILSAALRVKS